MCTCSSRRLQLLSFLLSNVAFMLCGCVPMTFDESGDDSPFVVGGLAEAPAAGDQPVAAYSATEPFWSKAMRREALVRPAVSELAAPERPRFRSEQALDSPTIFGFCRWQTGGWSSC